MIVCVFSVVVASLHWRLFGLLQISEEEKQQQQQQKSEQT